MSGQQEMVTEFFLTRSVNGSEIVACILPVFALLRLGSLHHARLLIGMARSKRFAGIFLLGVAFFVSIYLSFRTLYSP
jgi:dolichyl-phosphate-mannose--protein O-mannosyl transferase